MRTTPSGGSAAWGKARECYWHWEKPLRDPFPTPLNRAHCPKEGDSYTCPTSCTCGRSVGTVEEWGPRAGPLHAFFVQPQAVGVLSLAAGLDPWRQSERRRPPPPREQPSGQATLHCSAPSLSFPGPKRHRPTPTDNFSLARKSPEQVGGGERLREETPGSPAVRVALFTREAEEARPAGRWRRRGRGMK